ncbi:MAG: site-specific integrase [Butyrivibrio sp.]|nr:site-specific integrase [Butyrivibrio sp.]
MNYKKRFDKDHRVLQKRESQRRDGTYTYRWTDIFGKRHSIYASTLEDLRIKEQKVELRRLEGIREPPADLTVERLYDTWIKLKRGIRATTHSGYIFVFDSLIRPYLGKKRVTLVKRSDVRAFYISLLESRGLAITTVENVHNVLQQVFQYAVDDDILRKNPCNNVLKEIKASYCDIKRVKKDALTLKQEINFLKYLHDSERYCHWYPAFFIMANTGLRVGEFTGLRWQDVDLENGVIDVNHTLVYFRHNNEGRSRYAIQTPKTENGIRKVLMTAAVIQAFRMEKKYQDLAGIKSIDEIDGYEDFVFINIKGHVQNQGALNKAIKRVVLEYNLLLAESGNNNPEDYLPHFSCHILRHTYATRAIESGVMPIWLQHQLGHSEIQTTLDIYVTPTEELKNKEMKSFEKYMISALSFTDEDFLE